MTDEVRHNAWAMQQDTIIPDHCEQDSCTAPVETWCPLCERFLCQRHDELTPRRCHDCLGVAADEDAA